MALKLPKWLTFGFPFIVLGSPIALVVPKQFLTEAPKIYHYFFRVPLYSSENKFKHDLFKADRDRLEGYYKKYHNHQTNINLISDFGSSKIEGSQQPNLFVQVQRKDYLEGREWEWLNTVKLNQITIDRWFEKKANDSDLLSEESQYKELIKTEHLLHEYTKLSRNALSQDAIDIYFKKAHITTDEIRRLVYFPSSEIGQKNWYVWLDKDLLRLKLNLGFQIWFFNQKFLSKYKFVKNYFHKHIKEKKRLKDQLEILYKSLTKEEKDLFEFYFNEFWIKKGSNYDFDSADWNVMEFKSKDLNILYNALTEKSKDTSVFKHHLLQVVKGGDKESFELFFPNHITYASGPDAIHDLRGGKGYKPEVKFTLTPNKSFNSEWNVPIIIDWIRNYSIKHYSLRTMDNSKDQWPAIVFDSKDTGDFPVIRENYLALPVTI